MPMMMMGGVQQQRMRFQQQMGNFHLPGGNDPSSFNSNAFTFTNAQSQQANNMANAFGGISSSHQHPNPNSVHSSAAVPSTSRFITAPGDENGVPPPMLFLERESSYQPQDTILKLESLYRDASGVNTHEGSAGQGRATSFSIDDTTNQKFQQDFEDGSMPHGENDEGAAEFEFRGVGSSVKSFTPPGKNLENMYQNSKMYMPARQGSLRPFSSPMGQDVQRFKSVDDNNRRVDSKTNALALSPEQTQKQLEIQKMEVWMKEHGHDGTNLRGGSTTSTNSDGDEKKNDGTPIYDNSVPAEPEMGLKRK